MKHHPQTRLERIKVNREHSITRKTYSSVRRRRAEIQEKEADNALREAEAVDDEAPVHRVVL